MKKINFPLYHGTQCKAISGILKHGLAVEGGTPVHWETYQEDGPDPDMKKKRAFKSGVYLTESLEGALRYAFDASKDIPPEWLGSRHVVEETDVDYDNACVLQINKLPKGAKIGDDGYGDIMTDKAIPPEYITVLRRKDIEKLLGETLEELEESI